MLIMTSNNTFKLTSVAEFCTLQEKGEKGEPGAPVFGPVSRSIA